MTNVQLFFAGKRAEQYVIDNLLKLGAMVYVPVVDAEGVDIVVCSGTSEFVDGAGQVGRWCRRQGPALVLGHAVAAPRLALHRRRELRG